MPKKYLQWVEIDRAACLDNLKLFRWLIGKEKTLCAVVKANAYGHGIREISEIVARGGADWLGVNSLEEAILLRQAGRRCPIIVLGYIPLGDLREAVNNNLRLTVYNFETIKELGRITGELDRDIYLHVKVETGTHRQGVRREDLIPFVQEIRKFPRLKIEGLSSHFANIEDTTDYHYPQYQLENFKKAIRMLERKKIFILMRHMSCTASTILFPETHFDMVRVGIGLYGLWPSKETYLSCLLERKRGLPLKPVLSWKTRVAQIKTVPKGSFIGYGCTYRTTRKTKLAVLPVGYYDGYSRGLSNSSYVLIRGKRAEVRGRVAMDFIMVDATDIPGIEVEDEAVLIGKDGDEQISAEYLASLLGTISYEIVTRINPLVPRIIV